MLPCPSCGYDLRGLISLRGVTCPECGQRHSYRAITTIDPSLPPPQLLWYVAATPVVFLACAGAIVALRSAGLAAPQALPALLSALWAYATVARIAYRALHHHGRGFALLATPLLSFICTVLVFAVTLAVVGVVGGLISLLR